MKPVQLLVKKLQQHKQLLALAESVTCGLAAHKISTCIGASEVFAGGIVCYTPTVKNKLLKIPKKMIDVHTCESMEVTKNLAKNLRTVIKADIYAAITGLASKGGSETKEKPVGTVFFSICYKNKLYYTKKLFRGTPAQIKKKACVVLYELIVSKL